MSLAWVDALRERWAGLWTRPARPCLRCGTVHTYVTCPWCGA